MTALRVERTSARTPTVWAIGLFASLALLAVVPAALGAVPNVAVGSHGPSVDRDTGAPTAAPAVVPLAADPVLPQVVATVNVGSGPITSVYDSVNGLVYVVNSVSNNVSVLNGTTVVGTVDVAAAPNSTAVVAGEPDAAVVDPENGHVYVVDRVSFEAPGGAVAVIQGTTEIALKSVGRLPVAAAFDGADGSVYVANSASNNVSILSGLTVSANVAVAPHPVAVVFDPMDAEMYVADRQGNAVSVLSGGAVVASLPAGVQPQSLAYDPATGDVYVANNGSASATVLSGVAQVGTAPAGANPGSATYDPVSGDVVVGNANASTVTFLQGVASVATAPTGPGPTGIGVNSANGYVYVPSLTDASVAVLDGTVPLGSVPVGSGPSSATFDPVSLATYVTNSNGHTVSVLETAYPLYFNETGLPAASEWSVALPTSSQSSNGSSIEFGVLPGSYAYAVTGPAHYHVVSTTPPSPVTVGAAPAGVSVVFAPSVAATNYSVTFLESGLPTMCERGTSWSVTLGNTTESTTGDAIVFTVPNGTYNYSIQAPQGYSVASSTPASPVGVAGANVTVQVDFVRCGCSGCPTTSTFSVTFVEQGLRWGTTWCVTLGSTVCSDTQTIRFSGLSNGVYDFTVGNVSGFTANPSAGSVTLHDRDATVPIDFTANRQHHGGGGGGCGGGRGGNGGGGGGGGGWTVGRSPAYLPHDG